jgi:hypothetical protein
MKLIYDTTSKFEGGYFDPYSCDAVKQYEKHYSNLMYLNFIETNPRASFREQRQAAAEIEIARRKLKYWQRIADNQGLSKEIISAINQVKNQWQTKIKVTK